MNSDQRNQLQDAIVDLREIVGRLEVQMQRAEPLPLRIWDLAVVARERASALEALAQTISELETEAANARAQEWRDKNPLTRRAP